MSNLLRADFFALRKNKLTYILLAICAGMALLTVGLYFLINGMFDSMAEDEEFIGSGLGMLVTGRTIMFSSFSLTNNAGLIIPIFAGILTMSDLRTGAVRNKIIFGKSRVQIYFSRLIVSTVLCVEAALVSFAVSAVGSTLLFGYGVPFDSEQAGNFVRCLIIGILTFVYVASVSTFFAMSTKSTPLTVILTLAVCMGLGILCTLFDLLPSGWYDTLFRLIPTHASLQVSSGGTIAVSEFVPGVCSFLFFIALNTFLGILIFKKRDLK